MVKDHRVDFPVDFSRPAKIDHTVDFTIDFNPADQIIQPVNNRTTGPTRIFTRIFTLNNHLLNANYKTYYQTMTVALKSTRKKTQVLKQNLFPKKI